jgi:hypothetical protein
VDQGGRRLHPIHASELSKIVPSDVLRLSGENTRMAEPPEVNILK